jgi:CheY-like chemotaxis protein
MKRILVVDDRAYVREILCELLANEPDLAVAGAGADGREAIACAEVQAAEHCRAAPAAAECRPRSRRLRRPCPFRPRTDSSRTGAGLVGSRICAKTVDL